MKCLNCQKKIQHEMPCIFCKNIFCSYKCLRHHIVHSHTNNLLINPSLISKNRSYQNMNNNKNKVKTDLITSPYLIEGIYYKQRNFDEKYNLDNFIPVFENGEPKIIGGGSFGQVYLVTNIINKKLYAIKHMMKSNLSKKLYSLESIYKEIYIQSKIDHPNILPILYVKETTIDFYLVLEYAKGGSLFHYIRRRGYLDENLAFSLFIQVVNAVYFLHKNNLIHRDIKPENILIFENNIIKLCDFGWCVKLEEGEQRGTFCGTTEYMSPELVNHEEYSKEIDIWSLGVLLYEMVHGYSPFRPDKPNFNQRDVIENIRKHRLKFHKNISQKCKDLIYHLLDEEADKRYKIDDIFNSDFVKYYENRQFGFPDKFLIEKYKFKISKAKNILYPKDRNDIMNFNRSKVVHNKSSSNIINQRSNILIEENTENEFDENNISIIEKNNKVMKINKRKRFPPCLSQENLDNFNIINCSNKSKIKKLEKNKTFEYFPSLAIIDKRINLSLIGDSKSNKHLNYLKKTHKISNSFEANNNNQIIYNKDIRQENELPKNETKIRTIIINNYFPNVIQNSKYKNINKETKNDLTYENNFHIKSLKMSQIPKNKKKYKKINLNLSKKKLNSLINFNYLMIKNHLSPKIKLLNEDNKLNNLSKDKNSNNNESKIIEVNRSNYSHCSKISNEIPYNFDMKQKENKKIYTRNIINYKYDSMKDNNDSKDNFSKFNLSKINTNNNSYANFHVKDNLEEFGYKRANNKKIHHTKSMNLLNVNIKNENDNIKSLLKSDIANKINHISINSENKSLLNNYNKNNRIKNNNYNLNLFGIKKVNTNIYKTKPNSPLSTFNNNFIHTIFNRSKILDNKNKENNSLSNNISTLSIYDFNNNIQYLSRHNNSTFNNEKEKGKTMKIPIHKLTKLEINNNSSMLIPKKYL